MEIVFNTALFASFVIAIASFFYYSKKQKRSHFLVIFPIAFVGCILVGGAAISLVKITSVARAIMSIFVLMSNVVVYLIIEKTNLIDALFNFFKKNYKKFLPFLIIVPIIWGIFTFVYFQNIFGDDSMEKYVDTNGSDNYSLQNIDETLMIGGNHYRASMPHIETSGNSSGMAEYEECDYDSVVHSSAIFNGVLVAQATKVVDGVVEFTVENTINQGNARITLIVDGIILHDFEINNTTTYTLKNADGKEALIVFAGEDADMKISITRKQIHNEQPGDSSVIDTE